MMLGGKTLELLMVILKLMIRVEMSLLLKNQKQLLLVVTWVMV